MPGATLPSVLERHAIAARWYCQPGDVDDADENDVALEKVRMRVDAEIKRTREYFSG